MSLVHIAVVAVELDKLALKVLLRDEVALLRNSGPGPVVAVQVAWLAL